MRILEEVFINGKYWIMGWQPFHNILNVVMKKRNKYAQLKGPSVRGRQIEKDKL